MIDLITIGVSLFIGMDTVRSHAKRWLTSTSKFRGRTNFPFVVYGPPNSGKTTIAKFVIPHLLSELAHPNYGASYMNLRSLSANLEAFYIGLSSVLVRCTEKRGSTPSGPNREVVSQILGQRAYQHHVIVLDCFDVFYLSLSDSEKVKFA